MSLTDGCATRRIGKSIYSLSYGEEVLNTGKGPRKGERLSYEVGVQLIERTDDYGIDFVVDRETTALASTSEGAFDDHLVAFLHRDTAGHFQSSCVVTQQELKRRLALFVGDGLHGIHLAHDHHFFAVIVLRVSNDFGQLHQLGAGGG